MLTVQYLFLMTYRFIFYIVCQIVNPPPHFCQWCELWGYMGRLFDREAQGLIEEGTLLAKQKQVVSLPLNIIL